MTIYTVSLGAFQTTDNGVFHTVYTVPPSKGPAIVKCVTFDVVNGGNAFVIWHTAAGPRNVLAGFNNTAGTMEEIEVVNLTQAVPPGDTIEVINHGANVPWAVAITGYQFDQP